MPQIRPHAAKSVNQLINKSHTEDIFTPLKLEFPSILLLFAKSCPTLCDPMDCSMPGFPVLHYPGVCSNLSDFALIEYRPGQAPSGYTFSRRFRGCQAQSPLLRGCFRNGWPPIIWLDPLNSHALPPWWWGHQVERLWRRVWIWRKEFSSRLPQKQERQEKRAVWRSRWVSRSHEMQRRLKHC